jgi:hypothetical protein
MQSDVNSSEFLTQCAVSYIIGDIMSYSLLYRSLLTRAFAALNDHDIERLRRGYHLSDPVIMFGLEYVEF